MTEWAVIAAIVASGTALWIAYKAYPEQKEKDRELQVDSDKRKIYGTLLSSLVALHEAARFPFFPALMKQTDAEKRERAKEIDELMREVEVQSLLVNIYCSKELLPVVDEYRSAISELMFFSTAQFNTNATALEIESMIKRAYKARSEVIALMRSEIFREELETSRRVVIKGSLSEEWSPSFENCDPEDKLVGEDFSVANNMQATQSKSL